MDVDQELIVESDNTCSSGAVYRGSEVREPPMPSVGWFASSLLLNAASCAFAVARKVDLRAGETLSDKKTAGKAA